MILLAGTLVVMGPRLIRSDFAKREIVTHLSRAAGGPVHYARADFSFLPAPHLVITHATIAVPEKASADIESVTVYPEIWPLLTGRIQIAHLTVQSPRVSVHMPASDPRARSASRAWNPQGLSRDLGPLLGPIMSLGKGSFLEVKNGELGLLQGGSPLAEIHHIQLQAESLPNQMKIQLQGTSSISRDITLKARLDAAANEMEGHIRLQGLMPGRLPAGILPQGSIRVGKDETGLELAFRVELKRALKADLQGSVPVFTLMHGQQKTAFKGVRFKGNLHVGSEGITASVSDLHLVHPRFDLSGEMAVDTQPRNLRLTVEGKDVDIASVREAAEALAGDLPVVQKIFAMVRDGHVPHISVHTHGASVSDLKDLANLKLSGRIRDGRIFVPATRMDLADVSGNVSITDGTLMGTYLKARLGKSLGRDGTLKHVLTGQDPPFHLDIRIDADLTEALPTVKGLIQEGSLRQWLDRIQQIKGSATARLILGDRTSSLRARVSAEAFDLTARYRGIPYPVNAGGGTLSYERREIKAHQIDVTIGRSSLSGISGKLDWQEKPIIEMAATKGALFLDEIDPWIVSFKEAKEVQEEVDRLSGTLSLNRLNIKGPLLNPAAWRFRTEGRIRDVYLVSSKLPGPLRLTEGDVEADADTLTFRGLRLGILDALFEISGRAEGYLKELSGLKTEIRKGRLGPEAVRFLSREINLPTHLRPKSPLTLSEARFTWNRKKGISLRADMGVADGPSIALKMVRTPGLFHIKDLHIRDATSRAKIHFRRDRDAVGVGFSGNLTRACLDSLLMENRFLRGWIEGDLWGRIVPGHPIESTVEGHLKGEDISLEKLDLPATVREFSLKAALQRLRFDSNVLAMDNREIAFGAGIDLSEQGILLRVNMDADGIDLKRTLAAVEKRIKTSTDETNPFLGLSPVKGTATIKLRRLTYGNLAWSPFECTVSTEGNTVSIAIDKAFLCGISTPGRVAISPSKVTFYVLPSTQGEALTTTIACLTQATIRISGTFDFEGDIKGEGIGKALMRSLEGPIHFVSKNGRIDRFALLTQIFSLLNITEIFRGQLPDLRSQGFPYHSITVDGHLKDGTLALNKVLVDAPSMNIACTGHIDLLEKKLDLTVFAAPFKTVDRLLRWMPVVGYVLNYNLVSIAIKVTGDLKKPKVDYIPASMIGSGILGMMKRTLLAPVEVVTPVPSESGRHKENQEGP